MPTASSMSAPSGAENPSKHAIQPLIDYINVRSLAVWEALGKNNLWKRMLKNVVCTTATSKHLILLTKYDSLSVPLQLAYVSYIHPTRHLGRRPTSQR